MRDNISTPQRGETWYNGGTIDTNDLGAAELLGQIKVFEDINWGSTQNVKPSRSARKVAVMLVRNLSGVTVYAKEAVFVDPVTHGITGKCNSLGAECFLVDEFIGPNGVPANDVCWVVVSGPAMGKTPMTGAEFQAASISKGDRLYGGTTSGASTAAGTTTPAGRLNAHTATALTTVAQGAAILDAAANLVGKALTARTSGETNADILVDVGRPRFMM